MRGVGIPALTFLSATPPPSIGDNQWTLGDLAPGAGGTVVVDVTVNASLGAIVTSNAVLSAGGALSASSSANTAVNATPVLTLGLADTPDPVPAGNTVTYTLQYGNSGNEPATGVGVAVVAFLLLALYASGIALFQSRLAHAGYTAGPPLEWPDSPAAEAIANASRSTAS